MRTTRKTGQEVTTRFASKVVKKTVATTVRDIGLSRKHARKVSKCGTCGKDFTSKWKLMDHHCVKLKGRKEPFDSGSSSLASQAKIRQLTEPQNRGIELLSCSVCGNKFNNTTDLKIHISTHIHDSAQPQAMNNKVYICNVCKQTFETIEQWKEHIQQSANASHCDRCGQNFGCVTAKINHTCLVPERFACLECNATFKKHWVLKRHMLYQHKNFQCNICKKKFHNNRLYKNHLSTHKQLNLTNVNKKSREVTKTYVKAVKKINTRSSNERRTQEKQSISVAENSLTLDSVSLGHSVQNNVEPLPSKIKTDQKAIVLSLDLPVSKSHMSRMCQLCQKVFRSFKQLNRHRRFQCINVSENTSRHLPSSSGSPNQKSTSSGKGKAYLVEQKNDLLVTSVFKCRSCPKTYRSAKQLQLHKKIHKLVNLQLSCKKCGRQFWSKSHYADHMLLHTRKQLKCDICSKGMPTLAQLRNHRASHFANIHVTTKKENKFSAAKQLYDCNHCHQLYPSLKDFEDHCIALNLHTDPPKAFRCDRKPSESPETSCSVDKCAEVLGCGANVLEPTESAGLPEEAKECRMEKSDFVKVIKENCDHQQFTDEEKDAFYLLRVERTHCKNMEMNSSLKPKCVSEGENEKKAVILDTNIQLIHSSVPAVANFNEASRSAVCITQTITNEKLCLTDACSTSQSTLNTNCLSKVGNQNERLVSLEENCTNVDGAGKMTNAIYSGNESNKNSSGDNGISRPHGMVVDDKLPALEHFVGTNLTLLRTPAEVPVPNLEKRSKFSPLAKSLVAVYVRKLIREGISELSPHVCSFCSKSFHKPQGINNHYLSKHTMQEIENLSMQSSDVNYNELLKASVTEDTTIAKFVKTSAITSSQDGVAVITASEAEWSPFSDSPKAETGNMRMFQSLSKGVSGSIAAPLEGQKTCDQQATQSVANDTTSESSLNSFSEPSQFEMLLSELRSNFSKLFCYLVGDNEVLSDLGWPHRLIDEVLFDVIIRCDLKPSCEKCSLLSLRENISILLQMCVKEQAMENFGWKTKLVDTVVKEMLAGGDVAPENR